MGGKMSVFTLQTQDGVAIITMNDPSQAQNVLNQDIQAEFEQVFNSVAADDSLTGLVFTSSKENCFIAGADISMLQSLTSKEQSVAASKSLHALVQNIADLKITTVAAIDGTCLGGGLELALGFDYRVASDHKSTKIGVPEVQLGLLPGGGGTQRIPRLVSLPTALDLMLSGKQLNAIRAKKAGLIDAVVPTNALLNTALKLIAKGKPQRKQSAKDRLLKANPMRALVISQARKKALAMTKGKYPAPLKILDVVDHGLGTTLQQGLDYEAKAFSDLLMTAESKQLVNLFFASTELKKDSGVDSDASAYDISKVGVLGAGLMGAGIAYVSADKAGKQVRIKDISNEGVANGIKYVGRIFDKKLKRRHIKPHEHLAKMSRVTGSTTYQGFNHCDIVVEAVFEDLDLKQKMVADIEALNSDKEIIFATNTSAIPIDQVAAKAKHPERIVGMHYFSPVEKMPLLEVVRGTKTDDAVTATAVALGKQQGKTVIVVNDGPGFYTTRVLVPYSMEATRLILEGVAIQDIDAALESFGMPVGPIKLMDEVGIDVGAHIVETLNNAFGDRIPLIEGVDKVLADDRKGKKNKRGFYDYSAKSKGKQVDASIYQVLGVAQPQENAQSAEKIIQRVTLTMLNEAAYCLHEDILRSAKDGDIGAIFGLGFPPFLGGPFRYMNSVGIKVIVEQLEALKAEHGERFTPAPNLVKMAADDIEFYA